MTSRRRAARMMFARAAALLVAALLLAGCAALKPGPEQTPDQQTANETAPAGEAAYSLRIEAPDDLRKLLEQFLDIARYRRTGNAESLTDPELARLVAATPQQARALLETQGYFTAQVDVERNGREVVVRVAPGPRTSVESVRLEVQGGLQEAIQRGDAEAIALLERLRRNWSLERGEPFTQAAWSDAKNALLSALRAAGYAAASWSGTNAQVEVAERNAQLLAIADSGPLFRIGEFRIEGLEHHGERAVRNLAGFDRGAVATEDRLLDFQERLQASGLFAGVSVEIDADPAVAGATPLQVRVREAQLQEATVGVGVSANTGPRVSLEHLHRRPFGWAARAKNDFEIGRDRRAWEGELSSHTLPGLYRNLVSGEVERLSTADEIRTSWSARLGRAQDTSRIDRLYFIEAQSSTITTALGKQKGQALSGNYHGIWRAVDSLLLPTRGLVFAGESGAGLARSNFADSGPFGRLLGRLIWYRPIGRWYLQTRLELGQMFAADRVGLPDTLLFRAGGDESVRGYAYRTLGPEVNGVTTSGRVIGTTSFEIARPILARLPELWGAAFIDAGNAATSWSEFSAAVGVGVGVRLRSPIGALKIDLAYGEETRKVRLHFSIGVAL